MLVVPELENELAVAEAMRATQYELRMLREARADVDCQLQRLEWAQRQGAVPPASYAQHKAQVALLRAERDAVKERHSLLLRWAALGVREGGPGAVASCTCCATCPSHTCVPCSRHVCLRDMHNSCVAAERSTNPFTQSLASC
jgi:hypothetical protein